MTQIPLDSTLHEKLRHIAEPVELIDADGRVVARIIPIRESAPDEARRPRIDQAEIQRRLANREQGRTYTTAEVIEYLENL